jgi:hypothetical protein
VADRKSYAFRGCVRWMRKTKTDSDLYKIIPNKVSKTPKGPAHAPYHIDDKGLQLEKRPFSQTTRPKTAMIGFLITFFK